jgi:hypothetical protein
LVNKLKVICTRGEINIPCNGIAVLRREAEEGWGSGLVTREDAERQVSGIGRVIGGKTNL